MTEVIVWHHVSQSGPPPCGPERVFVGVNSAGYRGCFNSVSQDGDCFYETAEDTVHVMSDLQKWALLA